jgi:citronellol/citronellal dehydrogenase
MNRLSLISERISSSTSETKNYFKGKTIVVTGGSRGIGLAIARKCAQEGANVAILAKTT